MPKDSQQESQNSREVLSEKGHGTPAPGSQIIESPCGIKFFCLQDIIRTQNESQEPISQGFGPGLCASKGCDLVRGLAEGRVTHAY